MLTGVAACGGSGGRDNTSADIGHTAGQSSSAQPNPSPTGEPTDPATSSAASATRSATTSAAPAVTSKSPSTAATSTATSRAPSQGTPLAGRIGPGLAHQGVATAYASGDGTGACLFDPTSDPMIAAMNVTDYETAKACGDYILIHAANGRSITVRIVNECPAPCAPGQIDLSQPAFARLADLEVGRLAITWSLLSPAAAGTVSIRYKTGSSQWWCGIQVIGHRNPVALLEVRSGSGWRQLPRTDYNYFISADGTGCGGQIRVTDIYGRQLVFTGISLSPNVEQRTTLQFAQH